MITINLSQKNEYYTQRNNKLYPGGSCNTTSMIVGLLNSGVKIPDTDGQPEDALTQILDTPEAWHIMDQLTPWARPAGYSPRHIHVMLEWAVNKKFIGKDVVKFKTDVSIQQILTAIISGSCSVVSGRFTDYGHIVTVVGFKTVQEDVYKNEVDMSKVKAIIIDDPYGNWHTGYKEVHGNDIDFSVEQFNYLTSSYNDQNNKWAHVFNGVV